MCDMPVIIHIKHILLNAGRKKWGGGKENQMIEIFIPCIILKVGQIRGTRNICQCNVIKVIMLFFLGSVGN